MRTPRADTSHAAIARATSSIEAWSTSNVTSASAYAPRRSARIERARSRGDRRWYGRFAIVAAIPAATRSSLPRSATISPSSRIRDRLASRIGAPPPVSTTTHAGVGRRRMSTLASRSRNRSMPSCSMTSLQLFRARRSISWSSSTTLAPKWRASAGATEDLPTPGGPTKKRCIPDYRRASIGRRRPR